MRFRLLMIALVAAVSSAHAQGADQSQTELSDTKPARSNFKKVMITGTKFLSEIQSGDLTKMMHALGYFHAIEDVLEAGSHICRPDGISTKSAIDGLKSSIESDTNAATTPAALLISAHLTKAWPCAGIVKP